MGRGTVFWLIEDASMVNTEFVDALASDAAVPGGGGGAAYAGALAAALGAMVGNITAGKPKFADIADDMRASVAELDAARVRLFELIDEDAEAFSQFAATWKLPRTTEEEKAARHAAEQAALVGACEVPLRIMRVCAAVIESDEFLANNASKLVLSDVGASAILAKGALQAAALNVHINTNLMDDTAQAAAFNEECAQLLTQPCDAAQVIYDKVTAAIK